MPTAVLLTLLAACGSGGSGTGSDVSTSPVVAPVVTPTVAPSAAYADAYRFLNQATFGADAASTQALVDLGDSSSSYARWIDQQLALPVTTGALAATLAATPTPMPANFNITSLHFGHVDTWLANALGANDQLRQRVAFALSEILVTSQAGPLGELPFAAADYYDMLTREAFGNFRVLLEDVTLHPAMGVYLSMLGNQKAQSGTNIRPDENFAREIMQLMSIGLVQLNMDGTPRLDAAGARQATYSQDVIQGFARVFTGWKWACPSTLPACDFYSAQAEYAPVTNFNQIKPMQLYSGLHETGSKQLLTYSGAAHSVLPAGQSGAQDLKDALDNIFNHPNVAPFISRQLIQRLVTSNPSPAYVQRVAQVFADDGTGKRGNLGAVVKALLLDSEARSAPGGVAAETTGKVKEPLLRITGLWRAFNAHAASGRYTATGNFFTSLNPTELSPVSIIGEGPLQSGSVFNFFSPFYAPPGEISNAGRVAPELQLATEFLTTQMTNQLYTYAFQRTSAQSGLGADTIVLDTTAEAAVAADATALVNRVADRLLGSNALMSQTLRDAAVAQVSRTPVTDSATRVGDAIYLIASSPEYAVQK